VIPCGYGSINIGSDIIKSGEGSGTLIGNHLILASSISHPYVNIADPASLIVSEHQRNVELVYALTWLIGTVKVVPSSTSWVSSTWMNSIQCYSDNRWTFASDTFVGVCDIGTLAHDLVVTNVAVFGTWLKTLYHYHHQVITVDIC
jgi:hypothetical protein